MIYKNLSSATRAFYGVEFKPGDVKEVPGYINVPHFIRVQSLPETVSDEQSIEPEAVSETEQKVDGRRKFKKILKEEITDGSDSN